MAGPVHIYGLNAHGISAVRLAQRHGLTVTASDLNAAPGFAARVRAQLPAVALTFGEHPPGALAAAESVVISPGVVQNAEMWRRVTETPNWISVADFACALNDWPNPKLIITGTYGKTTLCTLLKAHLERSGQQTVVAGNYDRPISDVKPDSAAEYLIFELDYQQLVAAKKLRADAAVILNIQPGDEVFGSPELYVRTKLRAVDLVGEGGTAFVPPEVIRQARDWSLSVGPRVVAVAGDQIEAGLIPATTAALMNAALAALDLPQVGPDNWSELAGSLPRGRRHRVRFPSGLEVINDGAAKGAAAVVLLAATLERIPARVVLITSCVEVARAGIQVVPLVNDGADALDDAVRRAVALAGATNAVVAYSPGQPGVGDGLQSIPHRIDLFEQLARRYSQRQPSPDTSQPGAETT